MRALAAVLLLAACKQGAPPPPAADCARVADKLGGLLLGNYARAEERDRFVAETIAECEQARLTEEEAACILGASHRNALAKCPRALAVGDCRKITAALDALRARSGVDQFLVTGADRIASRCTNETPTRAFESCVLAARSLDDLDRCTW
jgi:hypothetical protein